MAKTGGHALNHLWGDGMNALRGFVETHGHPYVPREYCLPHGFSLGLWVAAVADFHRRDRLTDEQQADLDTIPGWSLIHDLKGLAPQGVTWG